MIRPVLALAMLVAIGSAPAPTPLRICSDPNNLPFSNERREGFENRIAELLARERKQPLEYIWRAQRRGFFRSTLNAGLCDVVIGAPADIALAATTQPYYRSSYVFVTRAAHGARVHSLNDQSLRRLRIGVQLIGDDGANAPPAHALSRRGIVENVVGYTVYGDYRTNSPPSRIVAAVARGEVDVAAVWGPLAGFYAPLQAVPLSLQRMADRDDDGFPLAFDISMAVRRGDPGRLAQLNQFITLRQPEIDRILESYRVPRTRREAP
jgi:mxaJ protein